MILWLDDLRDPTKFGFTKNTKWVKTYEEFTDYINEFGLPETVSFDNDLGTDKEGYDCAKWLVNYCMDNELKLPTWYVHSQNVVAANNIKNLLTNFEKTYEIN